MFLHVNLLKIYSCSSPALTVFLDLFHESPKSIVIIYSPEKAEGDNLESHKLQGEVEGTKTWSRQSSGKKKVVGETVTIRKDDLGMPCHYFYKGMGPVTCNR